MLAEGGLSWRRRAGLDERYGASEMSGSDGQWRGKSKVSCAFPEGLKPPMELNINRRKPKHFSSLVLKPSSDPVACVKSDSAEPPENVLTYNSGATWGGPSLRALFMADREFRRNFFGDSAPLKAADGTLLKKCPGKKCGVLLPLFQFGTNRNMADGMDTYCFACNESRRLGTDAGEPPMKRRVRRRTWSGDGLGRRTKPKNSVGVFDRSTASEWCPLGRDCIETAGVFARIYDGLHEFEESERRQPPVTPEDVYHKLFSGRLVVCSKSGRRMTPKCFVEHAHTIRLQPRFAAHEMFVDVTCSGCSSPP
jgi:hypothetical protein